jgi:hypothetical protein
VAARAQIVVVAVAARVAIEAELSTLQQVHILPQLVVVLVVALVLEIEVVIQYSIPSPIQVVVAEQTEMRQALVQSCQVARVAQAAENL